MGALGGALVAAGLVIAALALYLLRTERDKRRLLSDLQNLLAHPEEAPGFSLKEGSFALMENALKELVARLQQERLLRAREAQETSDSLMHLSHQLKTPLSALKMYEELAPGPYSDKQQQLILRMEHLVDMVLRLEKLRSGGYVMRFEQTVLDVPLSAAWARLKPLWPRVSLKTKGSAAARLDADWMEEAFLNLLKNACEHMPQGGQIQVELAETEEAVHIRMADSGGGVPQEALPRLFDRFFVSPGRKGGGGAGVGLSMVRQVVWAHHGEIAVHNTGSGLLFVITFPKRAGFLTRS